MRGLNKVELIGNAGKDPECSTLENNVKVCKFSLATTDTFQTKDGEKISKTAWHTVVVWRGLADIAEKYIKKGSLLFIEGKLAYRHYDDKEGNRHHVTEVVADNLILLDKKPE